MEIDFFIGPTYYQRLKQQVLDKYHSRDEGSKSTLTRQSVNGRALGGGEEWVKWNDSFYRMVQHHS